MLIDDEAQRSILCRLDTLEAKIASVITRQRRQEDISAEHHEDIRTILASLEATSAAVTVLMHVKYATAPRDAE